MQLTDDQIQFLRQHWPLEGEIKFHRRLANIVYFTSLHGREVVLRLTEPSHRKFAEIESELDWINYLHTNGMKVANPIASVQQRFIVEMPGSEKYFAVIFNKAPGALLKDDEDVPEQMIKTWGRYIGRMHSLTKSYVPKSNIQPRQPWRDESLNMALRSLDKSDKIPYVRLHQLLEWMESLPKTKDYYGLMHTDLHRGNFFVDQNQITAFDFDDSCHHWFSYDFVAPINSVHKNFFEGNKHPDKIKTREMFLEGYRVENTLDPVWIDRIEIFDKYRAALMYHWIKTFIKEGILDATGLERAKKRMPTLVEVLTEPIRFR